MKALYWILTAGLGVLTVLLVSRGAKPTTSDPARFLVLWRSLDGNLYEEAGWVGWWVVVEHGTIFNRGPAPV